MIIMGSIIDVKKSKAECNNVNPSGSEHRDQPDSASVSDPAGAAGEVAAESMTGLKDQALVNSHLQKDTATHSGPPNPGLPGNHRESPCRGFLDVAEASGCPGAESHQHRNGGGLHGAPRPFL
jgi:hypothetical protein